MNDQEFDELVEKYEAQGFRHGDALERANRYVYNRRRYGKQKAVRDAINQLKVSDLKKYVELVCRATREEVVAKVRNMLITGIVKSG